MSQSGNIKGAPGGFVPNRVSDNGSYGRGEEKTRIGRAPVDPGTPGGGGVREEKTRIGRAPVDPGTTTANGRPVPDSDPSRAGGTTKGGGTGIDFSQDGLVPTSTPRTERPRDNQSAERFESRPTNERPRPRAQEGGALASDFSSRPTSDRPQVPTRARDAEGASSGQFGNAAEAGGTQSTTRPRDTEGTSASEFDSPRDLDASPATDRAPASEFDLPDEPDPADEHWAPEGSERPRSSAPAPRTDGSEEVTGEFFEAGVEEEEAPAELGEPSQQPRTPGRGKGVEGRPGGSPGGSFEMPRGPGNTSPANGSPGTPLFDPARPGGRPGVGTAGPGGAFPGAPGAPGLPGSGTSGTSGVPGGRGDVTSLDALFPDLSGIVGQQALAEHFQENLLLLPPRQSSAARSLRLWAMFTAYAEANAKSPQGQTPAGRQAFAEALTANGYGALRDARTGRDGVTVALELLDAGSPEELQQMLEQLQMEPGAADHLHSAGSETHLPVAEEPRAREQQEARKEAARQQQTQSAKAAEQKEKDTERLAAAHPGQVSARGQDVQTNPLQQPGQLSQRELRQELEEKKDRERRGTNKRLGSNMLWGTLHSLRDSADDTAVLREKWNQLAFGAIVALVGMGLIVAMLVSL